MGAALSLALTDGISTAANRATLLRYNPFFVETHETCRTWQSATCRLERDTKLRAVLLLSESRDPLLLAICKCRPRVSCKLHPAGILPSLEKLMISQSERLALELRKDSDARLLFRSDQMADAIFIIITVVFFVISWLYVRGWYRLKGGLM